MQLARHLSRQAYAATLLPKHWGRTKVLVPVAGILAFVAGAGWWTVAVVVAVFLLSYWFPAMRALGFFRSLYHEAIGPDLEALIHRLQVATQANDQAEMERIHAEVNEKLAETKRRHGVG
jgi:cell division protein FtsW (lipid II flippase)